MTQGLVVSLHAAGAVPGAALQRRAAEGLVAAVALAGPERSRPLDAAELWRLALAPAEAWDRAVATVLGLPVQRSWRSVGGHDVLVLSGRDVAAHALWPDRHVTADPRLGALVGLPSRSAVVLAPVRAPGLASLAGAVQSVVDELHAGAGCAALGGLVHWWRYGDLVPLPPAPFGWA